MIHITPPIAPGPARFLPVAATGFMLGDREPLSVSLRRMTVAELDAAIDHLSSDEELDLAVHKARKTMKRLRAVLRLIRDELGEEAYRAENNLLRDSARVIAPLRDAAVMVETIGSIREMFSDHLRPTAFAFLEQRVTDDYNRIRADLAAGDSVGHVLYALRGAKARYRAWPVEGDRFSAAYGRVPVAHSFDSMSSGLQRTYRRGRREMQAAGEIPTAHNFHLWRKRVKYLRHQMEVLQPLWPEALVGYVASLSQLGDLLGEEHDFAELLRLVASDPAVCSDTGERTVVAALSQHRRSELQTAAMALGRRVYAESPPQFTARIGAYWNAWDTAPLALP